MQLGEMANVKTGLVLSRKKANVGHEVKATYNLLTLKNISEDGVMQNSFFEQFESNAILDSRYFTSKGDVLMRLSQPNTAIYIGEKQSGLLIPSYFAVIKLHQNDFLPQYLAWYLNSEEVKQELGREQAGNLNPGTNQHILRTLSVARIPIAKQQMLIEMQELYLREKNLYQQLLKEKEQWFKGVSDHILYGTSKEEAR